MIKFWEVKTMYKLVRLCADYIFTDNFDNDCFSEIACRYLYKLGIVEKQDKHWIYKE